MHTEFSLANSTESICLHLPLPYDHMVAFLYLA